MWKTNNFDGDKTWYSEEEYSLLKQTLIDIKILLSKALDENTEAEQFFENIYKAKDKISEVLK